ncbi:dynamin family protein [Marseilla massiliensis]|uniref:Dynamin family protein n=1 Tax=Marseilla massiliensis TaxID=1841864 RepID=A0A939B5V5_9BACT|nr:dynamin family protein [Marseilla massiliensis]MBM6673794.1 dynamin family protein [Marseilla massiliensis]
MNEIKATQQLLTEVIDFIKSSPWKADYQAQMERFFDLAEKPCVLAIAGQVKAGKSSFLNALLGMDLAAVGTTETTATINVFKYGKVKDPQKPVMVYWADGREPEAQTKEFIDSLQGYSDEVLEKAEKIDHLEYIVEDKRLANITLVDTPGFASVVDEHEQRTADFFNPRREKLRNRQFEQSGALTESADAVIFISGPVAKANAQKFFGERIPHISPFNAIGILAQIDIIQPSSDIQKDNWKSVNDILSKANELAILLGRTFEHELHTVLPVAASLYHNINKLRQTGELEELQKNIRLIPQNMFNKRFIRNSAYWVKEKEGDKGLYQKFFESCGLSLDLRMKMVGDMPWEVFCVIVITLYYLSLDEAVDFLQRFSGMDRVKQLLEERFFKRSKSIRCARILRDTQQSLVYIKNMELPRKRSEVKSRDAFLDIIKASKGHYENSLLEAFATFVKKNTSDADALDRYAEKIDSLLIKTDQLIQMMEQVETLSEGLILLRKVQHLLRGEEEIRELEILLEGDSEKLREYTSAYCNQRQRLWRARMQKVANNQDLSHLLAIVCDCYGKLLSDKQN